MSKTYLKWCPFGCGKKMVLEVHGYRDDKVNRPTVYKCRACSFEGTKEDIASAWE